MMKTKLIGTRKTGLAFILSAPAGTGKTTLVDMLTKEFPDLIVKNVSYTTRQPRPGEISGLDYNFISREEFEKKIANNHFLDHVKLYDDYYGTCRDWIDQKIGEGKYVFLVIDTQGAMFLKSKMKNTFPATYIFVLPPSLEELKRRLEFRKTESPEMIQKRLDLAKKEVLLAPNYDYNIINDDLTTAYDALRSIVIAEEHKVK